jgi:hypothetical protein
MHPLLLRGKGAQLSEASYANSTSYRSTGTTALTTTYTPSAGTIAIIVFVQGSGAHGVGTADTGVWSTGGGSGGYAFKAYVLGSPNPTHTVADIQRLYTLLPPTYAAMLVAPVPTPTLTYLATQPSYEVFCPASPGIAVTFTGVYINDTVGYAAPPATYTSLCTPSSTTVTRFASILYGTPGFSGIGGSDGQCGYAPRWYAGAAGYAAGGDYQAYGMQGGLTAKCAGTWSIPGTAWAAQPTNYYCGAPSILYPTKTAPATSAPSIAYGCGAGGVNSGASKIGGGAAIEIFEFK